MKQFLLGIDKRYSTPLIFSFSEELGISAYSPLVFPPPGHNGYLKRKHKCPDKKRMGPNNE